METSKGKEVHVILHLEGDRIVTECEKLGMGDISHLEKTSVQQCFTIELQGLREFQDLPRVITTKVSETWEIFLYIKGKVVTFKPSGGTALKTTPLPKKLPWTTAPTICM